MQSIQIFACDYRKNVQWNLPYIRIGDIQSDAIVNIGNDIENNKYLPDLSEMDKVWFIWKHLAEFGNPDAVGIFHYRRFLTLKTKVPILDIDITQFEPSLCIYPFELLNLFNAHGFSGASMFPLQLVSINDGSDDEFIWNQMVKLEPNLKDTQLLKKLFDIFYNNAPEKLKDSLKQSFKAHTQYLCNIFVLQKNLFNELCSMMFSSVVQFASIAGDFYKKNFHPRWLGYFTERLVSCYLHAIQLSGEKIMHLPLLTINGSQHNKVVVDENGLLKEIK